MTAHVLVFAIGPVQGFISAARRGRDLWYSSWLLSHVARAAGRVAKEHLVMPHPSIIEKPWMSISNKLTLIVDDQDPTSVAEAMAGAVRATLAQQVGDLLRHDQISPLVDEHVLEQQVLDLPEMSWSSVSIVPHRPYADARRLAEHLVAARKAEKRFTQPSWADPIPKSSLDGRRESVLKVDRRTGGRRLPQVKADLLDLQRLGIGERERLCGVGFLKRQGHRNHHEDGDTLAGRVLSTSHLASWPLRARFYDRGDFSTAGRAAFETFVARLRRLQEDAYGRRPPPLSDTWSHDPLLGRRDGHLIYESRLHDQFPKDAPQVQQAQVALNELFQAWNVAAKEHGEPPIRRPNPYYAVLVADGDRMGQGLNALHSPAEHLRVTEVLAEFASDASTIVGKHHGHCVYAGGDDVLALLPVTTVVRCAEDLEARFEEVARAFPQGTPVRPTLSAGICVSHHLGSLRSALEGGRAAEKHAKDEIGRDAWSVNVLKRSGVPVIAGGKWHELGALTGPMWALANSTPDDSGERSGLPRGLPHEIHGVATRLAGDRMGEVRVAEVSRILKQKGVAEDALGEVTPGTDLVALANRLLIARALSGMETDDGR